MKNKNLLRLTFSGMFLALSLVLPFLTGQIPQIGQMLCPMHIPVLLCGFICGAPWGAAVGLIAPPLRFLLFGMPPIMPTGIAMAFELAVYGFASGILYKLLPKKNAYIYIELIVSMIIGRVVWGLATLAVMGLQDGKFGLAEFWAGAVTRALPGIVLQIVIIPLLIIAFKRTKLSLNGS